MIITNEKPFLNFKSDDQLFKAILKGYRPKFNSSISQNYQKLIESCWSENPDVRPTFEQIVDKIKTYKNFIDDDFDIDEFNQYIENIDKYDEKEEIEEKPDQEIESSKIKYINIDEYEKSKKIGKGSFAAVYKVKKV